MAGGKKARSKSRAKSKLLDASDSSAGSAALAPATVHTNVARTTRLSRTHLHNVSRPEQIHHDILRSAGQSHGPDPVSAPTTRLLDVPSLAEGETIYCHPVTSEESLPESPLSTQLTSTRVAEHHTEPRQATATSNESWGSPGPAERDLRLCPDEISNAVIIPTDHSQSWSPYPKSVNHLQRLLSGYARSASAGKPAQTGQMESTSPTPTQIESSRSSSSTITPKRFASGAYGTLSSDSPSSNLASPTTNASADRRDGIDESAPLLSRRRSGNVEGADPERQPTPEASKGQQHEGQPEVRKLMPYIFPAMAIGVFLSAADQTVIASSYGKIGSDLDALNKTSWIATAYFLTLTSFQPLYGKLSDIFSRKSCLLVSYLIFGLGCLFCGLSQNVDQLILARAFAGIGGGGMTTVVSIILSDAIPLQDRGTWQGFINIIYAAGAGTGAPLGGFLADSIGWRWSFLAQAPLCLIALIAVALVLKLPERDHEHWLAKLRRVDFLGALVLVMAVFLLLWGMDRGANVSWTEKSAYIPVIVSLPLFALFLLVEAKVASEPFAPGHIIFARHMVFAYAGNFFAFAGYIATVFYLPLFFQAVRGLSATQAGFFLLPGTICSVSGSLASGFYMKSTGRYYWLTVAAYSTLLVGLIVLTLSAGTIIEHVPLMVAGTALAGLGSGIGVTTTLIALISNAGRQEQAVATACSYLFRSLGSTTGVSLASTAFNQILRTSLVDRLGNDGKADQIVDNVRRSIEYLDQLPPPTRAIVRQCYENGAQAAFAVSTLLVLGAAASAWGVREKNLRG